LLSLPHPRCWSHRKSLSHALSPPTVERPLIMSVSSKLERRLISSGPETGDLPLTPSLSTPGSRPNLSKRVRSFGGTKALDPLPDSSNATPVQTHLIETSSRSEDSTKRSLKELASWE
jgi:hypothetical protein